MEWATELHFQHNFWIWQIHTNTFVTFTKSDTLWLLANAKSDTLWRLANDFWVHCPKNGTVETVQESHTNTWIRPWLWFPYQDDLTSVHLLWLLWPPLTWSLRPKQSISKVPSLINIMQHIPPNPPLVRWIWCVIAPSGIARRQIYHGIDTWSSSEQWTTLFDIFSTTFPSTQIYISTWLIHGPPSRSANSRIGPVLYYIWIR